MLQLCDHSGFMIQTVTCSSNPEPVHNGSLISVAPTTAHAQAAGAIHKSKQWLYLCRVILLARNKCLKCLSRTPVELPWIMITISLRTISAFREGWRDTAWHEENGNTCASLVMISHITEPCLSWLASRRSRICFLGGGFVRDVGLLVSQRHVGDGQMCHVCSHFRCSSWFPSPISRLWVSYRWLLLA